MVMVLKEQSTFLTNFKKDMNWLTPQSVLCLRMMMISMDYMDGKPDDDVDIDELKKKISQSMSDNKEESTDKPSVAEELKQSNSILKWTALIKDEEMKLSSFVIYFFINLTYLFLANFIRHPSLRLLLRSIFRRSINVIYTLQ